jgi:hypothetical protein
LFTKRGCDINRKDPLGRNTLFYMLEPKFFNLDWIIKLVKDYKMDIYSVDQSSISLLTIATEERRLDLVRWMLDEGFTNNIPYKY